MKRTTWYEVCVQTNGAIREVEVRGNREGAARLVPELVARWLDAEMVFVRQHQQGTFKVLHQLTWKRESGPSRESLKREYYQRAGIVG